MDSFATTTGGFTRQPDPVPNSDPLRLLQGWDRRQIAGFTGAAHRSEITAQSDSATRAFAHQLMNYFVI
jgi:hypothetical protein